MANTSEGRISTDVGLVTTEQVKHPNKPVPTIEVSSNNPATLQEDQFSATHQNQFEYVSITSEDAWNVSVNTWRRAAHLARIAVREGEIHLLCVQLNSILSFVGKLGDVNVEGIEPTTSVMPMKLKMREDKVTDGGDAARVLANAPETQDGFFLVPKVVE